MRRHLGHSSLLSRRVVLAAGVATLTASPAATAQEAGRIYHLGFVVQSPRPQYSALFEELQRHGFVEGGNLAVDSRGFGIPVERLEAAAIEIVKAGPDTIYCGGDAAGRAVKRATSTIPIAVIADDVVRAHLVASLAHPGGNITGVSILATELDAKRLEILIEVLPGIRRMAALVDPNVTGPDQLQRLVEAVRSRGVELSIHRAATREQIGPAIDAAQAAGAQALSVLASPLVNANRALFIERTARARLPTMYQWPEFAKDGGLVCYGPSLDSLFRQVARQIVKLLTGTKPGDIPVQQPTEVELVINLKTAKALAITIPQSILLRADEVIE
jgi:putative ABC transport system substrate-binding protein